ncbi:MAG: alkaline phosphatase [Alphaproteobacteria bacterium]|nr:MAG: alkaline phosphatase [Alphaproteobacteria bacterium]
MNNQTRIEIEAAAFRRLLSHLSKRTDAQNIDLMGLSGFCRNCLSNWYQEAAADKGIALEKAEAREIIYGMPYAQWVEKYQTKATEEQMQMMEDSLKKNEKM